MVGDLKWSPTVAFAIKDAPLGIRCTKEDQQLSNSKKQSKKHLTSV